MKIACVLIMAAWAIGLIGGFAVCVTAKDEGVVAAAVLVLGVIAFPTVRKCYKFLAS